MKPPHTQSRRQASCHCCQATSGAIDPNPHGGVLRADVELGRKKIFGRELSPECSLTPAQVLNVYACPRDLILDVHACSV